MAYVVKYHGNIVAGPFLSNFAAVQAKARLYREYGSTSIGSSDFKVVKE